MMKKNNLSKKRFQLRYAMNLFPHKTRIEPRGPSDFQEKCVLASSTTPVTRTLVRSSTACDMSKGRQTLIPLGAWVGSLGQKAETESFLFFPSFPPYPSVHFRFIIRYSCLLSYCVAAQCLGHDWILADVAHGMFNLEVQTVRTSGPFVDSQPPPPSQAPPTARQSHHLQ